jgi:ribokinase
VRTPAPAAAPARTLAVVAGSTLLVLAAFVTPLATTVATARDLGTLQEAAVELDALVASGEDEGERYRAGDLDPPPKLVVTTAGALGGWAQPGGPYRATPLPGAIEDTYGAGDSFAVGLTIGLARGLDAAEAIELGAQHGAEALTRRGAHGAPVTQSG